MTYNTKINLINDKVFQDNGDSLTLSGNTFIATVGNIQYTSQPTFIGDTQLVTKGYVDNLTGGSGTVLASNGLTKVDDNITLGGVLTGNTCIDTNNQYGVAIGCNVIASGSSSFGFGYAYGGNVIASGYGSLAGGYAIFSNIIASGYGSLAGGYAIFSNIIASGNSSFGFGYSYYGNIIASGKGSFAGGYTFCNDIISGGYGSFVFGGSDNIIEGDGTYNAILGGYHNKINDNIVSYDNSSFSAILGGNYNLICGSHGSTILAGNYNNIIGNGNYNTILGGKYNTVTGNGNYNAILGGYSNSVGASQKSVIIGGQNNIIETGNNNSVILGGNNIFVSNSTLPNHAIVPNLAIFTTPDEDGDGAILVWNSTTKKVGRTTIDMSSVLTGATNGLTRISQDVVLGGALTGNTTISGGYALNITGGTCFNVKTNCIILGDGTICSGSGTAIAGGIVCGYGGISIGGMNYMGDPNSGAYNSYSLSMMGGIACGPYSIAIGNTDGCWGSKAYGDYSIAIGGQSKALCNCSIAILGDACVESAVAIRGIALGLNSISIGGAVYSDNASIFGIGTICSGNDYSVLLGGNNITVPINDYACYGIVQNLAIWDAPSTGSTSDVVLAWNSTDKKVKQVAGSSLGDKNNIYSKTTYTGGTILTTDSSYVIFVNHTSPVTITLPATPIDGQAFKFKDASSTGAFTNNITIARNGKNIDRAASDALIDTDGGALELVYDSILEWFTLPLVN